MTNNGKSNSPILVSGMTGRTAHTFGDRKHSSSAL